MHRSDEPYGVVRHHQEGNAAASRRGRSSTAVPVQSGWQPELHTTKLLPGDRSKGEGDPSRKRMETTGFPTQRSEQKKDGNYRFPNADGVVSWCIGMLLSPTSFPSQETVIFPSL